MSEIFLVVALGLIILFIAGVARWMHRSKSTEQPPTVTSESDPLESVRAASQVDAEVIGATEPDYRTQEERSSEKSEAAMIGEDHAEDADDVRHASERTMSGAIRSDRAPSEPPDEGVQNWEPKEDECAEGTQNSPERKQQFKPAFDSIYIHEEAWKKIRQHPRLKSRLSTLIRLVEHFYVNRQEPLNKNIQYIDGDIYKATLPNGPRIPFSFEDNDSKLVFWEILTHEEGEELHRTGYKKPSLEETEPLPKGWKGDDVNVDELEEADTYEPPSAPLYRVWEPEDEKRFDEDVDADLRWRMSTEQREYYDRQGPLLLKGSAGSGKTTIALYRLLQKKGYGENDKLYVTYTDQLKKHAARLYQQLGSPDPDNGPVFQTIEELCRSFIPNHEKRYPSHHKFTYEAFQSIPALGQFRTALPLDLLWEEIRGVLKGAYQLTSSDARHITREQYRDIYSNQSLVPKKERDIAYDAYKNYEQWINDRGYWDELDLARVAFDEMQRQKEENKCPTFQQIIVDEVQDLTTYHVQMLLELSENPYGLFLTGDAQQTIHPSRFEWKRVREQLYHYTNKLNEAHQYFEGAPERVGELCKNFRSPRSIVEVGNAVARWRNQVLKEENTPLQAVRDGAPICHLEPAPASTWTDNHTFSHRLMVIVPSDDLKPEAQDEFGKGRVFSVHEAKGLEADFVILWRFFSDATEVWQNPHRSPEPTDRDWRQRARYQSSLFTVAVTRAREELFILDEELPADWAPIQQTDFEILEEAHERLTEVLEVQSQAEDYLRLAQELEDRELYEQAAANYFEARHDKDAYRCQAIRAEQQDKYGKAARMYELAEHISDAVRCFERTGAYRKSFELVLGSEGGPDLPRIEAYLEDDQKLAKLDGDIVLPIMDAISRDHPGVSIATLFQYSRRRLGRQRFELTRLVDDIDTVSMRDIEDAKIELNRALTQMRVANKT